MNGTLTQRLENLSPAKRVLLEMKLKGKPETFRDPFSIYPRKESGAAVPLSFNQESLFFLEQLNPDTATYNLYETVRFKGKLNISALQQTLDAIIARHESLRTTFKEIDGQPSQIINAPESVSIQTIDLSQTSIEESERQALEILNDEAARPMNLQRSSLIEATLVRLAAREHIFLVKMHHIVSDGWSAGVFWKEFAHLYQSFSAGRNPSLPKLPIQFGDYAIWSRRQMERDLNRQTRYWKNQLQDAPLLLEMPADRPRPAIQSCGGGQETAIFPAALRNELKNFSQRENATLFMTLLAAFNALLARYTGQEDLVVGSPIAGRNRTETENLIGFFVNTLALRTDVSGDPTFRQLLARVKDTTLEAFSHQDLPFEKVVAAVRPERSLSHNPIFQVAFALQPKSESARLEIPGIEISTVKLGSVTAKFDLFLSTTETADGELSVTAEYNTDLFDAETVRRLIGHYRNLLEGLIENPHARVSELPLLSEAERQQILFDWNETATEYPKTQTVQELFENQAAQNPEKIVVVSQGKNYTYEQINQRSNQIAHYLRRLGVVPNMPVGIFMERSELMACGILGILKAGGAYLPLDSSYPQSRLAFMLENAGVKVILTTREKFAQLPETDAKVICLDADWKTIENESADNLVNLNQPDDPAYIIYTSGSTGQPKGTLIPHRAVNRLVFNTNYVQFEATDNVAHVSNVSFDAATFELWGALLHGAKLVVLDKDLILAPQKFVSELKTQKISTMFLTTSLFSLLARDNPNAFETLETLIVGGEALDPTVARLVLESNPPKKLINAYGPTESTTFATCHEIKKIAADAQSVPIGRPIANTSIYILDAHFNPVPVGVHGEIFIGGDGLAIGYLNRPELNAEKFISVLMNKLAGKTDFAASGEDQTVRLYRTGDIARYLPDGTIDYIGRKDNQIKLRGFRIELGEIEALINAHPAIKEGVAAITGNGGEKKIAAYYAAAEDSKPTTAELRDYLKQKLPDYMIPAVFTEVAEFARNPNGKIDRRVLPSPDVNQLESKDFANTAAKDELELKLTWIWQKVLGLNAVGIDDNFFDLGGHSLLAVRLFSEIEKISNCRLPLATLFKAPAIRQLAEIIRGEGAWQSKWESLVPLQPGGTKSPFFCVHAVGGNVLEYNDLANRVNSDQPFYALQSFGLDGKSAPLTEISEMAKAYIKEIKQIQPEGPYFLGGRSFGGTVAYEMARLLVERDEKVALLAIFDSYPKNWLKLCSDEEALNYKKRFRQLRTKRHLENLSGMGFGAKTKYVLEKLNYKSRKYKSLLWRFAQKFGGQKTRSVGAKIREIEEINYSALKNYVPKVYPGTVTFFSALEEVCPEENLTGWRRLARGGVEVIEVPGDHQTMIKKPHVGNLAEALEKSIRLAVKINC